jgi:hypothetical protein
VRVVNCIAVSVVVVVSNTAGTVIVTISGIVMVMVLRLSSSVERMEVVVVVEVGVADVRERQEHAAETTSQAR